MASGASSISVTVRVRPFTIREAAQLTKTGWCLCLCLCLRGIVALMLQWTCLADRVRGARRPGVPVLATRTSRDPGGRCQGFFTWSARGCSRSSSSGGEARWRGDRVLGAEC